MKPGIIYGNLITVTAGFVIGSSLGINYILLVETLLGISLIIGGGCVLNNIIDRDIDALMERTKGRVMVKGLVPVIHAYVFAAILGSLGAWVLGYFTNPIALATALFGLFAYIFIYSLWSKRSTVYGTLLGSISGAVPIVVGYVAARGQLDLAAIIVFFILVSWQMPHSYAIALFRMSDYKNAHIPVLPIASGTKVTKVHMLGYIIIFCITLTSLYYFGYAGEFYLFTMLPVALLWATVALIGFWRHDNARFGKAMFALSIVIILLFSVFITLDYIWSL